MELQFKLDTSQPSDLAQLSAVVAALQGAPAATAAPAPKQSKPAATKDPAPTADALPSSAAATTGKPITVAELRELCITKVKSEAKAVIAELGYEGLAEVPAEVFPELKAKLLLLNNK